MRLRKFNPRWCTLLPTLLAVAALLSPLASKQSLADDAVKIRSVISDLDQPFLFAYSAWNKKATVEDGKAVVRNTTNQGGAGFNLTLDLSQQGDASPAILVKSGKANQMKTVRLMLMNAAGQKPVWWFPMPPADDAWHWVTPVNGASLETPNAMEVETSEPLSLKQITQWQIIGDWAGGVPTDFEIDIIAIVDANQQMIAARQSYAQQIAAKITAERAAEEQLRKTYGERSALSPKVTRASLVAPNRIALEIQAGKMTNATYGRYQPNDEDQLEERKNDSGEVTELIVKRDGRVLGSLIGENREFLVTHEKVTGNPLLEFAADDRASYSIQIADGDTVEPIKVSRKTRVNAWAHGSNDVALHHTLYLELPDSIKPGSKVKLTFPALNTFETETTFVFDPNQLRSESVHVHQIGYRPDDPIKRAFVSCWLGNGGSLNQPKTIAFSIIDDATGKVMFRGEGGLHFPSTQTESMARTANFNGTDVAKLEFSEFSQPGRYRVVVDSVGCSFPFEIANDVWTRAWRTQLRGLYHNRSGIKIGPPHSDFRKPRDMHPDDGYRVTQSTYRAVEAGNEAFDKLVAGDTGEPVNGWGGYHDAGDWNPRRVTHMRVTMAMLEIYEQFSDRLNTFDLNIPKSSEMPDILAEAVFEFSCFHRLQHANGGVGMGLESKGDPLKFEVSWHNSFASYAYAPDYLASWCYASVAARLSRLLEPFDPKLAAEYLDSGKRAFDFAESDFAKDKAAGLIDGRDNTWIAIDYRNLAALELFRTTKDDVYHERFMENTSLKDDLPNLFRYAIAVQRDHAFAYASLPDELGDKNLKRKAVEAIERLAENALTYASKNAFNLTCCDQFKPQFLGFYSTADAYDLTRAHALTGKTKYLYGAVQATQFQSGCNPNNVVYTTGLGANPLQNVFKLDARFTGQKVPEGLTPYGNIDFQKWNDNGISWPIKWHLGKVTTPNPYAWPTHEAYWDLGGWPMLEEFTVDAWAPNVLVWGYLAMRNELPTSQ
ncbi:Endoglucanase D precursor [Rubripirellula amarantea]|uniref:Endoglucanase D n=1 Tax=Rubripirellula amarantea TaxID=2527999 RepID=A0A5C5WF35_9BACT|nr:glycoside hydrolase family 9 protein [Rubripirellula amarantea]TWT49486.1 Endoglucanase D precursor [Rubripirellula amarantea]